MKKIILYPLIAVLVLTACSKSNSKTDPVAPGISAMLNGKYVTFNDGIYIDTSGGEIFVTASCDSAPYRGSIIEILLAPTGKLKPGLYPNGSLNPLAPYTSELGISTTIDYSQVLFGSYNDSVIVNTATDSTVTGTFFGDDHGQVIDQNNQPPYRDSTAKFTNGKFSVKW